MSPCPSYKPAAARAPLQGRVVDTSLRQPMRPCKGALAAAGSIGGVWGGGAHPVYIGHATLP
eukprot:3121657-Heterocapsa_arctica.AAC.1